MVVLVRIAAAGRELLYTSASFSGQSDFASQKYCICAPWYHKIRLSSCRRKASVNRYLPVQQMAKPAPFSRQAEAKV